MGQPMRIVATRQSSDGTLRFEIDRSITGMGHESYDVAPDASSQRLCDVLARRLFDCGNIRAIHMFSNVVSVTLGKHQASDVNKLLPVIEQLFIHYRPGVQPTPV